MQKLLVLPGNAANSTIGGATVSLVNMVKGFEVCNVLDQLCVVVWKGSLLHEYLVQEGYEHSLSLVTAPNLNQFLTDAFQWIHSQPSEYPLLLENFTARQVLPILLRSARTFHSSQRAVFHMFRDRSLSTNLVGNLWRKLVFHRLRPQILCNSHYTASHIGGRFGQVVDVLFPPIDLERFSPKAGSTDAPPELRNILKTGHKIMLTPARIRQEPEPINDKNLRSLIPLLASLKARGHPYHSVVIGKDTSSDQKYTKLLKQKAESMGVGDAFTILPSALNIQDYYKCASVIVTLAPDEPFGRTVIEAIACGVPVVGSRTGGIGEILSNFAPEWMVNPFDSDEACAAVIHAATDASTQSILNRGLAWVKSECSAEQYALKMMKITKLRKSTAYPN